MDSQRRLIWTALGTRSKVASSPLTSYREVGLRSVTFDDKKLEIQYIIVPFKFGDLKMYR